jgi:hypothetical protein
MSNTQKKNGSTFQEYDQMIKDLEIEKSILLKNSLYSENAEDIIKAQSYLSNNMRNSKKENPKAYFFPNDFGHTTGKQWKDSLTSVPDHILRRVSYVHVVDLIIQTKINQVLDFLQFQTDDQKSGFTVRKKLSRFDDRRQKKRTKQEEKEIEKIVDFIENSGEWDKWDTRDDLHGFISKTIRDSFTFNRATFEKEFTLGGDLIRYFPIDAQTVRLLQTIDPFYQQKYPESQFIEKKGYLPRYCQIWNSQIAVNPATNEQVLWYPWELGFEIRRQIGRAHV